MTWPTLGKENAQAIEVYEDKHSTQKDRTTVKLNENVENSTQSLRKTKEDVKLITNKINKNRRLVKTYILKRNTRCFHQKRFSMPIISRRGYI